MAKWNTYKMVCLGILLLIALALPAVLPKADTVVDEPKYENPTQLAMTI